MEQFGFSTESQPAPITTFNGPLFYNVYKNAEFLRASENVERILSRGYELRQKLKDVPAGTRVAIEGMSLERNTPFLVRKTGEGVKLEDCEFTYNRLSGLVAAYAFENRHRFPVIDASEPKSLGLVWDNASRENCRLYLSAISGTEHFTTQFSFWPLICALRKYQLKKMPENLVVKIASIKNDSGQRMGKVLFCNLMTTKRLWTKFPGSSPADLLSLLEKAPPQLKKLFR